MSEYFFKSMLAALDTIFSGLKNVCPACEKISRYLRSAISEGGIDLFLNVHEVTGGLHILLLVLMGGAGKLVGCGWVKIKGLL